MTHASVETAPKVKRGRIVPHGDVERLPALRPGFCDYCNRRIIGTRLAHHARFCCDECRKQWVTLARNRGAQLYQLLLLWRRYRGRKGTPGAGMFTAVAARIDAWTRADKEN